MRSIKSLVSFSLIFIFVLSISTVSFASDSIINVIKDYGYEVVPLENVNKNYNLYNFIEINSVEELDALLTSIKKSFEEVNYIKMDSGNSKARMNGVSTKSEWAPFYLYTLGSVCTVWKSCTISYTYESRNGAYNYFTSIKDVTSKLSGIVIGQGWVQTGYAANIISNGSHAKIEIDGYGYVGVDIKGIPTAIRIDGTQNWDFSFNDI